MSIDGKGISRKTGVRVLTKHLSTYGCLSSLESSVLSVLLSAQPSQLRESNTLSLPCNNNNPRSRLIRSPNAVVATCSFQSAWSARQVLARGKASAFPFVDRFLLTTSGLRPRMPAMGQNPQCTSCLSSPRISSGRYPRCSRPAEPGLHSMALSGLSPHASCMHWTRSCFDGRDMGAGHSHSYSRTAHELPHHFRPGIDTSY